MMQNKKSSLGLIILLVSFLGLLIAFSLFLSSRKDRTQARQINPDDEPDEMDTERFHRLVQYTLPDVDETTRRIITAQAMHETGLFTSSVFIRNNNAFGMRMPEKRPTRAFGDPDQDGYANYDNLEDSIEDLALWFDFHNIPLKFETVQEFASAIKEKGYYEAPYYAYSGAMNKHYKTLISMYDEKIT